MYIVSLFDNSTDRLTDTCTCLAQQYDSSKVAIVWASYTLGEARLQCELNLRFLILKCELFK